MHRETLITPEIIDGLSRLFDDAPPHELRDHLLEIYHVYIIHEHKLLPGDFEKIARNMYLLTNFLRVAEKERGSLT